MNTADPYGDAPSSAGPRKVEIERHYRASIVMRARAVKAATKAAKARCLHEADRLLGIARGLAKDDEDAQTFEETVRSRGGVWFPKDDGLGRGRSRW